MRLHYKLTRTEYQHMGVHIYWSVPKYRARITAVQIGVGIAILALCWLATGSPVAGCIGGAIGSLIYPRLWRRQLAQAYGQHYDMIAATSGKTDVEITEHFLYASREHIRSEVDWEAFTALDADEVGFYFTYGPLQTVFVPRRLFATEMEAQRFWDLAQSYWQFSKQSSADHCKVDQDSVTFDAADTVETALRLRAAAAETSQEQQRLRRGI